MSSTLASGDFLDGRYQVGERLGAGGMGVVFRATDTRSGADCALKLLLPWLSSGAGIARFKREFRAAVRLSHPNCVRVFELGQSEGRWYFTMEYLPGRSLRPGVNEPKWVGAIALQVASALDYLHSKQIVHRDIKPANILVSGEPTEADPVPRVKLGDFGIAKAANLTDDAEVGSYVGSLRYLAPEQLLQGQTDVRSDLYSFGIVLYELIAGSHPLPRPRGRLGAAGRRSLIETPPVPLAEVAPGTPKELVDVVMRLLEKDPRQRPAAAAEVYDELESWLRRDPPRWALPSSPRLQRGYQLGAPSFVGRGAEVAQLETFLGSAFLADGSSASKRLLLISGPAGAGKSRVVGRALRLAEELGARLHLGTCVAEETFPYAALGMLMSSQEGALSDPDAGLDSQAGEVATIDAQPRPLVLAAESSSSVLEVATIDAQPRPLFLAAESSSSVLEVMTTDAQPRPPSPAADSSSAASDLRGPTTGERDAERLVFWRIFSERVLRISRKRPTLILLEDVQWADTVTVQLLGFLIRAIRLDEANGRTPRIAILMSHRPAPDHVALAELVQMAGKYEAVEQIALPPLPAADAAELVASMLMVTPNDGVKSFATGLQERTEGNPLFMAEVLHALLASGRLTRDRQGWNLGPALLERAHMPSTLQAAIGDRAARLWVETKRTLEAAAVVGRRFGVESLAAATALDSVQLLDCLDEAIRAGFVEELPHAKEGEPGYWFVHDRFRESIYERLPEAAELHGAVAKDLERREGGRPERAGELAYHFGRSGDHSKAYRYGLRAAEHAMDHYAFSESAKLYGGALAEARAAAVEIPPEITERYGDAALQAGLYEQAGQAFEERLETLQDPLERSGVLMKLADVEYRRANVAKAIERFSDVLAEVGAPFPSKKSEVVLGLLANVGRSLVRVYAPRVMGRADKDRGERAKQRLAYGINARLAEVFFYQDSSRMAHAQFASLEAAEHLGPGPELLKATALQAFVLALSGKYRLAGRYAERARALEPEGAPWEQSFVRTLLCMQRCCEGRAVDGANEAQVAADLLAKSHEPHRAFEVWTAKFRTHLMVGRMTQAQSIPQQLWRLAEELGDDLSRGRAHTFVGHLELKLGRSREAISLLHGAVSRLEKGQDLATWGDASSSLARALAMAGQPDEAAAVVVRTVDRFMSRNVKPPLRTVEGAYLAAAALIRQQGYASTALDAAVGRLIAKRKNVVRQLRSLQPAFTAGRAAWEAANGNQERGRLGIESALKLAEGMGLLGEVFDIHSLAAQVLSGTEVRRHSAAAEKMGRELMTSVKGPPSP